MIPRTGRVRALAFAVLALTSCMEPTPFGTDTLDHDLNRTNSERLLASAGPTPLRFVALGDTHDAYDELLRTIEQINATPDVDFVVHVGDTTNFGLLKEYEWTQRALARLRVPVLVVLGNHDAISSGQGVYRNLYGPFDFSFEYKRHKFVFFNSNYLEFPGVAPDREWIDAQLSDLQDADSAVLFTHQNVRSADGPLSFYESAVGTHPVSLVVHGHLTHFALDDWNGVPVLQCSTFQKTGLYTVVSVVDHELSFELCRRNECVRQTPALALEGAP